MRTLILIAWDLTRVEGAAGVARTLRKTELNLDLYLDLVVDPLSLSLSLCLSVWVCLAVLCVLHLLIAHSVCVSVMMMMSLKGGADGAERAT